jgi:hypothetical protein
VVGNKLTDEGDRLQHESNIIVECEISGSQSGENEDIHLVGYCTV